MRELTLNEIEQVDGANVSTKKGPGVTAGAAARASARSMR